MSRWVKEWVGKTDDEPFPPRVKVRILERFKRRCANCGNLIVAGRWICDHIIALINGGQNRESNGQPLCDICNPHKNAADVAEKSAIAETIKSHYGLKKPKHPMPGSRQSKWKKKVSGEVVLR